MTRLRSCELRFYALGLRAFRYVSLTLRRRHPRLRAARFSSRPERVGSLPIVVATEKGWVV